MDAQVTSPVLVGRRDELRVLGAMLDRAAAGEFALAAIGGEAGIGKTRLSMLAGELARRQGFRVLIGGCLDIGESTVPYGPLLEALRQLWIELDRDALAEVLGPASAELGSLIPELGPPMAAGAAPGAGRVFELLRGVLQRLAQRQPVLVIIEDLHWADHATRDLLRYLSRNLQAPAVLIATYRSEELPRHYPVRKLVADLHRHPGYHVAGLAAGGPAGGDIKPASMLELLTSHRHAPAEPPGVSVVAGGGRWRVAVTVAGWVTRRGAGGGLVAGGWRRSGRSSRAGRAG